MPQSVPGPRPRRAAQQQRDQCHRDDTRPEEDHQYQHHSEHRMGETNSSQDTEFGDEPEPADSGARTPVIGRAKARPGGCRTPKNNKASDYPNQ